MKLPKSPTVEAPGPSLPNSSFPQLALTAALILGIFKPDPAQAQTRAATHLACPASEPSTPAPNFASDVPPELPSEVASEWSQILNSCIQAPYTSTSGGAYVLLEGELFYNSEPKEKRTWGRADQEGTAYVVKDGQFVLANGFEPSEKVYSIDGSYSYPFLRTATGSIYTDDGVPLILGGTDVYQASLSDGTFRYYNSKLEDCDANGVTHDSHVAYLVEKINKKYPELRVAPIGPRGNGGFMTFYIERPDLGPHKRTEVWIQGWFRLKHGQAYIEKGSKTYSLADFEKTLEERTRIAVDMIDLEKGGALKTANIKTPADYEKFKRYFDDYMTLDGTDANFVGLALNQIVWLGLEKPELINGQHEMLKPYADKLASVAAETNVHMQDTLMWAYYTFGDHDLAKKHARLILDLASGPTAASAISIASAQSIVDGKKPEHSPAENQ